MKIANFSIERPVTISMIMIVLVLVGAIALPLLRVDLYPSMNIPVAVVTASWAGASPEEVERQVTKPLEAAMASVQGVKQISSNSRQGGAQVIVQFNYGVNLDQAMLNMRDKIDRVRRQLPDGVDAPQVMKLDPNSMPILILAMSGPMDPVELKRLADDVVQPRLSRVDGVASAMVSGGQKRQIQVVLDPFKMQAYGLSVNQVVQALQSDNTSADAGVVDQGTRRITVHVTGDFQSVQDIGNVPIRSGGGGAGGSGAGGGGAAGGAAPGVLYLKDIADIRDTFAETTQRARLNHQPSVSIDVYKVSDGNTVQVSNNVHRELQNLQKQLPPSVKLTTIFDQADFIKQAINTVVDHTLTGAVLSIAVLYLFLRKMRTTLIVGVVIPISVISTFSLMYFSNQTINIVTLGGLALGLGSLVDFAVVVLESIFRYRNQGLDPKEAAKQGTAEVGTAVVASALAQIVVFAPIAFTQGLAQQLFSPLALTVSFSHLAALFGALTLVPMLASRWMPRIDEEAELRRASRWNPVAAFGRGMSALTRGYGRLLRWALGHRKTVIAVTVAMFAASVALVPFIGFELTPKVDEGQFQVSFQTATGTNLETTNQIATKVEQILNEIPEVDTVFTQVGGGGVMNFLGAAATDRANLHVQLKPLKERQRSTDEVVEEVRQKVALIPGARFNVNTDNGMEMGSGAPVQVRVSGPDLRVLQQLGDTVEKAIASVPGIRNVQNSLDRQVPQFQVTVDRQRAAQYGLSVSSVVSAIRTASAGTVATQYHSADSSIDVVVKYPDSFTRQYENLQRLMIATQTGGQVALGDVATIKPGVGPVMISRENQTRSITISADVFNVSQGNAQQAVAARLAELPVPDGYTVEMSGQAIDLNESFRTLGLAMPLAIVLVYMVMASQFESLFSPFIIMFSLPPTFIGAALGLALTHRSLSINALIGMIMLLGIVVNNAIVLVDYTNQLRKRGLERNEAILQAGPVRLRPILMTTATTVLAMLPLVIGYGEGAEAQAPMATVVAFGLTFSTLVTLVLVPVVYTLFDDFGHFVRRFARRLFRRRREAEA